MQEHKSVVCLAIQCGSYGLMIIIGDICPAKNME